MNAAVETKRSKSEVCKEIQSLQRKRVIVIKSRNMQANRLQAIVAGTLGYSSGLKDKERLKKYAEASALIKAVLAGEGESELKDVILTTSVGIQSFNQLKDGLEKEMLACVKQLNIYSWTREEDQRGFGPLFLAIVLGETGDLDNYENPGKLWRRMGCAPWEFNGKCLMGATWKSRGKKEGKLPKEEWEKFGYCPRRRSIAYLIGESMVKMNKSIYRKRYDESKAKIKQLHKDYPDMRCHLHGMLLATKLLLRNLWMAWDVSRIRENSWR